GHSFYWFSLERPGGEADAIAAAYHPPVLAADAAELLSEDGGGLLAEALAGYLAARPWFEGRALRVESAAIVEAVPLGDPAVWLVFVEIGYEAAEPERYLAALSF